MNPSKDVTIDLNNPKRNVVHLVQGDNTRTITLTLLKDDLPYDVTEDLTSSQKADLVMGVKYVKANGVSGYYETTSTNVAAVTLIDGETNRYKVAIDNHATDVPGFAEIFVTFSLPSGRVLHSFSVVLEADQVSTGNTDPDKPYYQSNSFVIAGAQPSKTSAMTKQVGIDANGQLWSDPGYVKPSGGIPVTDLAASVQTSLSKANSALQTHQSLANIGIGYATNTQEGADRTVSITGFQRKTGSIVVVYFANAVPANATLNVSGTGAAPIYHIGFPLADNVIVAYSKVTFVYGGGYYHVTAIDRLYPGYVGSGLYWNTQTASTVNRTASINGFRLVEGGHITVRFSYAVPANATLNVSETGQYPIKWRNANLTSGIITAGTTVTFMYRNSAYHIVSLDNVILPSVQATKTSAMTQEVGVDSNGKLWTTPGEGGESIDYPPTGGIPKTDLSQSVQDSLDLADSALQEHQTLENIGIGWGADLTYGGTIRYVTIEGFQLRSGSILVIYFKDPVPADSTLNVSGSGAIPIYYRNDPVKTGLIGARSTVIFVYRDDRFYVLSVDNAIAQSVQVPKTEAMTQPIGVDSDGVLWTEPASEPLTTFEVNIVYDSGSYQTDKTSTEIRAAIEAGRPVAAQLPEGYSDLVQDGDDGILLQIIDSSGGTPVLISYSVNGDVVTHFTSNIGSELLREFVATISATGTPPTYSCDKTVAQILTARGNDRRIRIVDPDGYDCVIREITQYGVDLYVFDSDSGARMAEYHIAADGTVSKFIFDLGTDEEFVATISKSGSPPTYSCDRTLSAINAARNAGRDIRFVDPDGWDCQIRLISPQWVDVYRYESDATPRMVEYAITPSGVVQTIINISGGGEGGYEEFVATISLANGVYSCDYSSSEIYAARQAGQIVRIVGPSGEDLILADVKSVAVTALKYSGSSLNLEFAEFEISTDNSVLVTTQEAARPITVITSSDTTASIAPINNQSYVYGTLLALTITSGYSQTGDWSVEFDTVPASSSVGTSVTIPSSIVMQDTPTFEKGYHYEINVHNNHALIAGWPIPASS